MGKTKYAAHSAEFRAEAIRVTRESRAPLARIARELVLDSVYVAELERALAIP